MAKKRPNGDGSIRHRKDGLWEARYSAGRDPGSGKPIRKSLYGKTEKEVRQKLRKINVELEEGTYVEPSKMTVGVWLDIWLKEYNGHVAPSTIRTYESHIRNHIKPGLGAVPLQVLSIQDVQKFCNNLQQYGQTDLQKKTNRKPLSAKTISVIHGIIHKALEQALDLGYIKTNSARKTKLPKIVKPEIKPLTDENAKAFIKAINKHRFRRLFFTVLFTGMREGELVGLTWQSIHFNSGEIEVRYQLQKVKDVYTLVPLKNDKFRVISPAPLVMEILKEQQLEQKKLRLKAGSAWHNDMNLVFTDELGGYITGNKAYKAYKRVVKEIGIPEARLHDLRHTFAVNSIRAGDDIKTIQQNLGHHSAAFTLDVYGHVTDTMRQESSLRMQAYIDSLNVT